jgi:uncharacterized protein (DUF1778 family)
VGRLIGWQINVKTKTLRNAIVFYIVKLFRPNGQVINMATSTTAKRESLNIRIKPDDRDLIDYAAKLLNKNRTDFVLEASRRFAEESILDQTVLKFKPEAYAEFLARLDAPPQPNERLRKALQTPAPWE